MFVLYETPAGYAIFKVRTHFFIAFHFQSVVMLIHVRLIRQNMCGTFAWIH